MTVEEKALDFLKQHKNADEIVVDAITGLPVKAVYTRINGNFRRYPAVYWFETGTPLPENAEVFRASGDAICTCGNRFADHPRYTYPWGDSFAVRVCSREFYHL